MNFGKFRILIWKSMSLKEMILLMRTLLKYDIYLSDLSDTYLKKISTVIIMILSRYRNRPVTVTPFP
jgi:hypothetical protein